MVYSLVYQTLNVNENKGDQGMHRSNGGTEDNIGEELELREASSWAHFPRKKARQNKS